MRAQKRMKNALALGAAMLLAALGGCSRNREAAAKSEELYSRITGELDQGECAGAERDVESLAGLGGGSAHQKDVPGLRDRVKGCQQEENEFRNAREMSRSRNNAVLMEAKTALDRIAAKGGRHAEEARTLAAAATARLSEPVQCIVAPVAHQTWNGPVNADQIVDPQYLDGELELLTGPNCGLEAGEVGTAALGKLGVIVEIDPAGAVTEARLFGGGGDKPTGEMFVEAAKRGWRFAPPTARGRAVRTRAVVDIQVSKCGPMIVCASE